MKRNRILIGLIIIFSSISFVLNAPQPNPTTDSTLGPKERSIIGIAALTAKGDLVKLKTELNVGLNAGLTINQIKEAIVHLYAYAGFPRSIRELQIFMTILDERKANGIVDVVGAIPTVIDDELGKYERGKEILEELTGSDLLGPGKYDRKFVYQDRSGVRKYT